MADKHTPGPWSYDSIVIMVADGSSIGEMSPGVPGMSRDEAEANARLAAAAPDMLAALRELDALREGCGADELGAIAGKRVAAFNLQYRAAIAKATKGE